MATNHIAWRRYVHLTNLNPELLSRTQIEQGACASTWPNQSSDSVSPFCFIAERPHSWHWAYVTPSYPTFAFGLRYIERYWYCVARRKLCCNIHVMMYDIGDSQIQKEWRHALLPVTHQYSWGQVPPSSTSADWDWLTVNLHGRTIN
jgi:hypothetical protein